MKAPLTGHAGRELSSAPRHGAALCCLGAPGPFCTQHSSSTLKEKIQVKKKTMPLFSKSHKNPAEIVKILKENMAILEKQEKKTDKV